MARTAIAPANLRPLAPTNSASRSNSSLSQVRSLKPLLPNTRYRPVVLPSSSAPSPSPTPTPVLSIASPPVSSNVIHNGALLERSDSIASGSPTSSAKSITSPKGTPSPSTAAAIVKQQKESESMQPKKKWVLPARAKPGRKPSDVEPPTKRKAQNRASQRAFRERKQSYVSSLEEKIEDFEKREAGLSIELQKMAKRLKEENQDLKKENQKLKEKLNRVEKEILQKRSFKPLTTNCASTSVMNHIDDGQDHMASLASKSLEMSSSWSYPSSSSHSSQYLEERKESNKNKYGGVVMNRDCGFCTDQSRCVCSGEAALDLTQGENSHLESTSVPIKEEKDFHEERYPGRPFPTALLAAHSIPSPSKKLWYTVPSTSTPSAPPVAICPTESRSRLALQHSRSSNTLPPLQTSTVTKPKLWSVYSPLPNPAASDQEESKSVPIYRLRRASVVGGGNSRVEAAAAACSGDPAHCNACSTDPALAAFCRVVASHLSSNANHQGKVKVALLDAGNALPLRNHRKRSHDGAIISHRTTTSFAPSTNQRRMRLYTSNHDSVSVASNAYRVPVQAKQTIPEAWQKIKQHPSFSSWQGGLNLLADVVSKRADQTRISPPSSADSTVPRVEIEKNPSIAMRFHRRSNDRQADEEASSMEQGSCKRRKLYVDKESVEDALALLDQGFTKTTKEKSCVCPLNRNL